MYINESLKEYLDDLAGRSPTPGGGSAAALTAAMGCALISMVANYTISKTKYQEAQGFVKDVLQISEKIRQQLMRLVDQDVEAYKKYYNATKLLETDEKQRQFKKDAIQSALKEAVKAPLNICRLTVELLKVCPDLAEMGNPNLVSDVGVGALLLECAFNSAALNVRINLKQLKDEKFCVDTEGIIETLKKDVDLFKKSTLDKTQQKIEGIIL